MGFDLEVERKCLSRRTARFQLERRSPFIGDSTWVTFWFQAISQILPAQYIGLVDLHLIGLSKFRVSKLGLLDGQLIKTGLGFGLPHKKYTAKYHCVLEIFSLNRDGSENLLFIHFKIFLNEIFGWISSCYLKFLRILWEPFSCLSLK